MNQVIIPCFSRPEFLYWCLFCIKSANNADQQHYIFQIDHGYDLEIITVIDRWMQETKFSAEKIFNPQTNYSLTKQSFNVLQGYKNALERVKTKEDLIFMIEEDVMINEDFFNWHKMVHNYSGFPHQEMLFCSIAVRNPNRNVTIKPNVSKPGQFYLTSGDYCSLGVCFRAEMLREVCKHANNDYYSNAGTYMRKHFPESFIGGDFIEQDGLIRRIQETHGMINPIAFPFIPRGFHSGFYGKNRMRRHYTGPDLQKSIDSIGSIIFDADQMKEHALNPDYFLDSMPVPLNMDKYDAADLVCYTLNTRPNGSESTEPATEINS